MAKVHLIQTYDEIRDEIALALQENGFEVVTHSVADLPAIREAFAAEANPVAIITSQMDSRFSSDPYFGNRVAYSAKTDTEQPTLTIVYSGMPTPHEQPYRNTDKDTVVEVRKDLPRTDCPVMIGHLQTFFAKHQPS